MSCSENPCYTCLTNARRNCSHFCAAAVWSDASEQQDPQTEDEAATDQQHSLSNKAPQQQQQQQQQPLT